ncbi:uncharacterized protein [Macrobrachium rosenbergii]|uniref:uncharacterized protein n=1 Tax=Macrobrachium rosenbergii TaxID=79674 RepID=UPI0034D3F8BA
MVGKSHSANPASRSCSSVGSYDATKEEVPCRYSYVRASNTYHRYGRRQSSKTSEDTSNYSSREDLLECKAIHLRKKKNTGRTTPIKSIAAKNVGCSSSDDLLNDESDATDGFLSSGIPETDGSVFSSQEDLLEPQTKCSANVTKFIHRHSSVKGGQKSRISRSSSIHVFPLEIRVTAEQPQEVYSGNSQYYTGRECITPLYSGSEDEAIYKQQTLFPGRGKQTTLSPSRQSRVTFSPKSLQSCQRDIDDTEEYRPLRLKVQSAIVKTVRRLIDHLGNIHNQVGVIENKCSHLQDTMCTLEHDQYLLHLKFSDIESRFENLNKLDTSVSDSDSGCPHGDDDAVEGKCSKKESHTCKLGKEHTKHATHEIIKVPGFSSLLVLDDLKVSTVLAYFKKLK